MGREGRKFKICSSCMLLIFTFMIIYFGETTVKRVKNDIKQWSEEELAKKLIMSKIHREYNLKKAFYMKEHFVTIYQLEVKKYHAQAFDEISEDGISSLQHIVKEDRIWNAIIKATFFLRGTNKKETVTKKEWQDSIEFFTYAMNDDDEDKVRKDQMLMFNKIAAAKKGADQITLKQYQSAFDQLRKILQNKMADQDENVSTKPIGDFIFKYLAFEMALYHSCHKLQESDEIEYVASEKCQEDREVNKLINYIISDPQRWQIFSDCFFTILDENQDGIIDAVEIDHVLLELSFSDTAVKAVQEALVHVYERNNTRQINHDDYIQVMDRMRYVLQRYEEEQNIQK